MRAKSLSATSMSRWSILPHASSPVSDRGRAIYEAVPVDERGDRRSKEQPLCSS